MISFLRRRRKVRDEVKVITPGGADKVTEDGEDKILESASTKETE